MVILDMTAHEGTELVKALAWPVAALVGVVLLYGPICAFLRDVGKRATKFSLFKVDIELAKLAAPRIDLTQELKALTKGTVAADLDSDIEKGSLPDITAAIASEAADDFVIVDVGDKDNRKEWPTSRLFLLAAFLERSRSVRCIVFTERGRFFGAAWPRDVRAGLGIRFPEYERAFYGAAGDAGKLPVTAYRGGELSEAAISALIMAFLRDDGVISKSMSSPIPESWIHMGGKIWELAEWVTTDKLILMLGGTLMRGAVIIGASGTSAKDEVIRAIVDYSGPYVAMTNAFGEFRGIYDRGVLLDRIARDTVAQAVLGP